MTGTSRSRTRARQLDRQLRDLRRQWRDWTTGRSTSGWWGVPWCDHRQPVSGCEGCATRMFCRDRAAEVATRAEALRRDADRPAEGELLRLTDRGWVTV